ncbi:radical SAM/SPASM domain-containing protein [Streptomyces millisiae]|uniref:Radical SAM protein n=1 Tax=Streptomyces millisiae TaxID=3075542 RepID=A0ABU2LJ34_9ACTN|nr:radical SAM protein [Streptomyces sp. DSM 44918]MDT0317292.1 radical SAM protein [Streptomyces sp. DSM 44918]
MTRFLWLDLTRKCQLSCVHCYNASGPGGTHGTMSRENWIDVLDQAAACGVRHVQLIGGEPTLHPHAAELVDHALADGLTVEVYSNLVHVTDAWWRLLQEPGVSLATSYYSDQAAEHNAMTRRPSHTRTRANIEKAVRLGIALRVGIVAADEAQRVSEARSELRGVGVTTIGVDRVRPFGRGASERAPDAGGLCGRCGDGRAAIGPDGEVSPCVFSDWMSVGNVRSTPLARLLDGALMTDATATIRRAVRSEKCAPDQRCYPDQTPCYPAQTPCAPKGDFPVPCPPDQGECRPGYPSDPCGPFR